MNYKLRSSVSVVDLGNNVLELFKTNTRKAIRLRTQDQTIEQLILNMDGQTPVEELGGRVGVDITTKEFSDLISY